MSDRNENHTATITIAADAVAGMDDDSVAVALVPRLGQFNEWDVSRSDEGLITVNYRSVSRGDSRPV